jgi:hypothetical protein
MKCPQLGNDNPEDALFCGLCGTSLGAYIAGVSTHQGMVSFPDAIRLGFQHYFDFWEVGLQEVRFHDLRHTHATMMLKANVNPKVVMERLGYYQIAVTLDTYSHVVPGMQEKAALAFDEMLKDSSLTPTSAVP